MRTHSPLVLDVRELLESHGIRRPLAFSARVPDLSNDMVRVAEPVDFDLVLENIEGGVLVQGTMAGTYSGTCRRCAKELVHLPFSFRGSELYRPVADAWEEEYVIKEHQLDLEPMVRDTVALNLPTNPLCTDDCKGLCPACGTDLNEGSCSCEVAIDPRWTALKELGERLN
jgi:uncharacterized protein